MLRNKQELVQQFQEILERFLQVFHLFYPYYFRMILLLEINYYLAYQLSPWELRNTFSS